MRIMVVGGAGFIGHNVVQQLEELGHHVVVVDNWTTYGILEPTAHMKLIDERMSLFNGAIMCPWDISNREKILASVDRHRPEVIIHLASFPRAKIVNSDPLSARSTMIDGLEHLLTGAKESKVKRFVYISSSMVYGDFEGGVTEDAPCKPGSIYAAYKHAGELLTKHFAEKYNMEYSIVRPSAVYGPRDVEDRVVSKFFMNALHDKPLNVNGVNEKLDFSYVDDVARGIVLAATHVLAADETFNITRGEEDTILRAAELVRTIVGKGKINVRERDMSMPSRGYLSTEKAYRLLNYEPRTNIEQGFPLYYEWIQNSLLRS
jgi:nucleoside-diphosphate-sugar epimerase